MHGAERLGGVHSAQSRDHYRRIALCARRNPAQSLHQSLEHILLLVVIAVAHSGASGVAPEPKREEEGIVDYEQLCKIVEAKLQKLEEPK
jgi:hypothetical protein